MLANRVTVGILYGDFYSSQDSYPYGVSNRLQRHRIFIHQKTRQILRVEMGKELLEMAANATDLSRFAAKL